MSAEAGSGTNSTGRPLINSISSSGSCSAAGSSGESHSVIVLGVGVSVSVIITIFALSNSLKKDLGQLPVPMKCNLFLLRGYSGEGASDFPGQVRELLDNSYANGIVFVHEAMMDIDFHDSIVFLVDNLCHNSPFGSAISSTYARYPSKGADPMMFLSQPMADLRLKDLVEKTIRHLKYLPGNIKIDLPPSALERLNMDVSVPGYTGPTKIPVTKTGELFDRMTSRKENIVFHAESTGATGLSEINKALYRAEIPKMARKKQLGRFIQVKSFIRKKNQLVEENRAFIKGTPSLFRIRIGPSDKRWESLTKAFPVEKLPKQQEAWRLTVILGA